MKITAPPPAISANAANTRYGEALHLEEPVGNAQAAATVTLFIVANAVLVQSARPLNLIRLAIVLGMMLAFVAVLFIPILSDFFALSLSPERYSVVAIGVGAIGAVAVGIATRITDRWRRPPK